MRLFHRVITLPILALFLLMSIGGSGGVVLCLGEDGHVGIELEKNGSCIESSKQAADSPDCQIDSVPHCHCGPCLDIPLGLETAGARLMSLRVSSSQFKILLTGYTVECRPLFSVQVKATDVQYPTAPPPDNQTLLSLRTVILLI